MKRLLAFLLVAVLIAGAFGTSAFAEPGKNGKVHWKDQLIADWDEMLQEYLELKDELEDEGSLDSEDQARFDELEELLTGDSKLAKKFYLALRNHLNNRHYSTQEHVQSVVQTMNQFKEQFENWDVLPFNSIISHKYNFLFDTPPMLAGGRTLVPVRAIVEGLGADVEWIPYWDNDALTFGDFAGFSSMDLEGMSETADEWLDDEMNTNIHAGTQVSVVRITLDDIEIALFIDFPVAYVNDDGDIRWEALDTKPQVFDDRTYVPLRFVSETFGLEVTWDDGTIVIDDDDDEEEPEEPSVPSDIERESDEVTQDPFTKSQYALHVTFDPADYDVIVYSIDGIDQDSSVDKLTYFDDESLFGSELNGYYVGLAIDVPDEVDNGSYDKEDLVYVKWRGSNVEVYTVIDDQLYVYLPVTPELEGTSPNLEIKWDLGLDKETFDVKLQYLRFEDEPIEEVPIVREDDEIVQYDNVGGFNLDFNFDGDDKELDIVGGTNNLVPFLEESDPLPAEDGNYVGIRIPAPNGFVLGDFEYLEYDGDMMDSDEFDLSASRLVFYLPVDKENEPIPQMLRIKWGPGFVDEDIEIRWFNLNLEEETMAVERAEDSVRQDPANTGGTDLFFLFDDEDNKLFINTVGDGEVAYYESVDGTPPEDGNWVGIEILRPTNYDGTTIDTLTVGDDTWNDINLNGNDNDRLWYYFKVEETGNMNFDIEILWADNYEWETIEVDAEFDALESAPESE